MKITPDSNVLIRAAIVVDDPDSDDGRQAQQAIAVLCQADLIAITVPALCELVWVLRGIYKHQPADISRAIRSLCASAAVVCDRQSIEAGLQWLEVGGDFADGAIAASGRKMGAELFVSFDRKALRLARRTGQRSAQPSEALRNKSQS